MASGNIGGMKAEMAVSPQPGTAPAPGAGKKAPTNTQSAMAGITTAGRQTLKVSPM
jgi:hypothetical protein